MAFTSIASYSASGDGRSWQGAASDGTSVWLISDRTTQTAPYTLSNNIDTFNRSGTLLSTDTAIYTGTTPINGDDWNFVDGFYNATDGYLYLCCTNWHSNATPNTEDECQILVLDPSDWSVVTTYNLTSARPAGTGSIESVAKRGSEWWVCWSHSQSIKRFNSDFSSVLGTYSVPVGTATPYGDASVQWWQGLEWNGDVLYANLHGANTVAEATYAPGLIEAWWNGTNFELVRVHVPPTYGAGQGFCRVPGTQEWWFADRPGITLVQSTMSNPGVMEFDGASGYINALSGAAIDDLASGAFTVSAWITPDTVGEGGTGRIATKRSNVAGAADNVGGWLFFTDATSSIGFITSDGAGGTQAQQRGADNAITLGARQHVLVTYNNSGDRKGHIYVGGSEITYDTDTAATGTVGSDAAGDLLIGGNGDSTRTFDGLIEELAIWDSVLGSSDIASLVAGTRPDGLSVQPILVAPNIAADAVVTPSEYQIVSVGYTGVGSSGVGKSTVSVGGGVVGRR